MTLQEQLRESARFVRGEWQEFPDQRNPIISQNLDAAADRIDALEAALRNALSVIDEYGWFDENGNDYATVKAARKALESL